MKTKIITLISVLFLSCFAAFADENDDLNKMTGVYLTKKADYDYAAQRGTITLENFVGQVTKMIHLGQSAEIVLVVDGSSSMGSTGMAKLHAAVKSFITELYDACAADRAGDNLGIDHRVSLVVFGTDANMLCNFKSVYYETDTTPYTSNTAAANAFDKLLLDVCTRSDNTYTSGGTMTHMALGLAYYIMEGNYTSIYTSDTNNLPRTVNGTSAINQNWTKHWTTNSITITGARSADDSGNTCSRYVVLMTDGALEGTPDYGTSKKGTKLEGDALKEDGRDEAVAVSRLLKADKVSIYTVGFLDSENQDLNNMLNNVSSNWLTPTSSSDPFDPKPHDYYSLVSKTGDASALSAIFNSISGEIASGCAAVNFDETTTAVSDVLNDTYFELPKGTDADDINIYTIPCKSYNSSTKEYTWSDDETEWGHPTVGTGATDIHVSVNETDGSVEVKNFNFTNNWCGMEYNASSTNADKMDPHGCKLVIEIPFTVKEGYNAGIGEVETNLAEDGSGNVLSGFKGTTTGSENFKRKYATPKVDLYELTIAREGLKNGESAIYTVKAGTTTLYTIVLTGNGGTSVSQKMLFVPEGTITVTETTWNQNTSHALTTSNPLTASVSKTSPYPTVTFKGTSLGVHEDVKANNFSKTTP